MPWEKQRAPSSRGAQLLSLRCSGRAVPAGTPLSAVMSFAKEPGAAGQMETFYGFTRQQLGLLP